MNEEYQYTGDKLLFGTSLVTGASPEIGAKKKAPSWLQWRFSGEGRRFRWSGHEGEARRCFWKPSDKLRWPETRTAAATATRTVTGAEWLDEEGEERGEKEGKRKKEEGEGAGGLDRLRRGSSGSVQEEERVQG